MRWLPHALAAVLLAAAWLSPAPPAGRALVHPLAPPLTRLETARTLAGGAPPPADPAALLRGLDRLLVEGPRVPGAAATQARLGQARAQVPRIGALATEGLRLRAAVQQDAVALAQALGPGRVDAAVARREELGARWGEGRAWREAEAAVRERAGTP